MKRIKKGFVLVLCFLLLTVVCPIDVQAASTVKLNKSTATIYVGKTVTLKISGTTENVTWNTSNKKVATVNSKGKVTGKKAGSATITATVGNKSLKCKIKVKSVLSADKASININSGETEKVKIAMRKSGTVYYEIEDTSIVSCSWEEEWFENTTSLTIKAKSSGNTTITLTNTYNNEKIKLKVAVVNQVQSSDDIEDVIAEVSKVNIKLEIPHIRTNNSRVSLEITNRSKYDISISGLSFNNGYTCHWNAEKGYERFDLESGYKVTLTYYRAFLWDDINKDKYNDMYLDNDSTGWIMITIGDELYKLTYDRNGTIEVTGK